MKIISIKCVASSRSQVDHIMDSLNEAGFPDDDISVSFPDHQHELDLAETESSHSPSGMGLGAALGGITGAVLGGLTGIGILNVPGLEPFVTAGPAIAALCGAVIGATLAGILGGLIEFGLPNNDNRIFIFIQAMNHEEAEEIGEVLKEEGAHSIQIHGDAQQPAKVRAHFHQPQWAGH
jgi:hypothetical protein